MLYRPEDFRPLTDERWSVRRIRAGIEDIVADTDRALRGPKLLWPAEAWDRWQSTSPQKTLYCGAAGVIWALDELRRRGHAETMLDLAALARATLERNRARPDFVKGLVLPAERDSALLTGESGILLVACRIAPSRELADDLHRLVLANVANPPDELMWGSPGTLLAARSMFEWTGEARWRAAWDAGAEALLARRGDDGIWVQRLYGYVERTLGPVHGLVGNVLALGQGLPARRRSALHRSAADVLARTAVVEGALANWPPDADGPLANRRGEIRVQWCHGAPGIVASAAEYLDQELRLAGAELTWRVGPHGDDRGSSICHGTAGNGYAFLKAFARTGEERWLARARRFAVHALGQMRLQRERRGRGRYSLWTGDLGVALFLADCLDARTGYPVLEA